MKIASQLPLPNPLYLSTPKGTTFSSPCSLGGSGARGTQREGIRGAPAQHVKCRPSLVQNRAVASAALRLEDSQGKALRVGPAVEGLNLWSGLVLTHFHVKTAAALSFSYIDHV